MRYNIVFSKNAKKDFKNLSPRLQEKTKQIIRNNISINPYCGKKLAGELKGLYSVRLSYKDRIVYSINKKEILVIIFKLKTHYGN